MGLTKGSKFIRCRFFNCFSLFLISSFEVIFLWLCWALLLQRKEKPNLSVLMSYDHSIPSFVILLRTASCVLHLYHQILKGYNGILKGRRLHIVLYCIMQNSISLILAYGLCISKISLAFPSTMPRIFLFSCIVSLVSSSVLFFFLFFSFFIFLVVEHLQSWCLLFLLLV